SNCTVAGDFTAEVDYDLVSVPDFPPGFTTGIYGFSSAFVPFGGVIRGLNPVDQFVTFAFGGSASTLPPVGVNTAGRLRITRPGSQVQGAVPTDGGITWTDIDGPVTYASAPARLLVGMATSGAASVTMDQFELSGPGTLSCPLNHLCGDGTAQTDLGE